jgi:flap endonuclease-1
MGIKYLNRFLREKCPESITHIEFSELTGKKIAIDISIYLYKYEATDSLLENIYLMLATFRHYNIIPVFIFDGKPPDEKKELLKKRKEDKISAQTEYNELKAKLENISNTAKEDEKLEIVVEMNALKKQFITINRTKINKVKELIRAYGASYYDAPGEADALCAMLVITNKVWACLSEDMDLFVYGCNKVLRYLSLSKHSAIIYYTKGILKELNVTQKEFKDICVLSGTDYNTDTSIDKLSGNNINSVYLLFNKYKNETCNNRENKSFYDWIDNNNNYISNEIIKQSIHLNVELLEKISKMFDFSNELFHKFKDIKIVNGRIQKETIRDIMREDGFLFIN